MARTTLEDIIGPLDEMTSYEVTRHFQQIMAAQEGYGGVPQITDFDFAAMAAAMSARPRLFTFVDLFCGAGGSSTGLTMAGGLLLFAANHSRRAIETHATNFRDAEHKCADINHYDMRNLPRGADVLWASPICTEVSPAGGNAKDETYGQDALDLEIFGRVEKETFERTRATFHDVVRAAEVHMFKYVIVENVVESAIKWKLFPWWLSGMEILGYEYQILCVSSAHVGGPTNPHAPQRRDRMYVVFHRADVAKPDIDPRPECWCDTCGPVVGFQWWKNPKGALTASGKRMQVGKYGIRNGQYVYRCPNAACKHSIVTPYERPATTVLNWDDMGVRIADRKKHGLRVLTPNTLRRIKAGMSKYRKPMPMNTPDGVALPPVPPGAFLLKNYGDGGQPGTRVAEVTEPFSTTTTGRNQSLINPDAFFYCPGGSWRRGTTSATDAPFRTLMTTESEAVVTPDGALIDTHRNHAVPEPVERPFTGVNAGGNHHGLLIPYYSNGQAFPTDEAMRSTTTRDRFGFVPEVTDDDVMAARYRMVSPREQARAQRFPVLLPGQPGIGYVITGNEGEQTAQAGNAVSANVAQMLGERIAEALNRTAAIV